jgi:dTDP-4-dehydrorhamnose reductase
MNQKSNVKRLSKVSDTLSVVTKQIEELTDGDESAKAIWVLLRSA